MPRNIMRADTMRPMMDLGVNARLDGYNADMHWAFGETYGWSQPMKFRDGRN